MPWGSCRGAFLAPAGQAYVAYVNEGAIWFFPPGFPHSLQGLGPDGCEFVIAFDDGHASEFNTLLVTDFLAHTPPDILSQNFGVYPFYKGAGIIANEGAGQDDRRASQFLLS